MKLGSLFDGSGGFPLAAKMCGIDPVWASEIEEYPIRVTKKNFPQMKHLGDVTKINGAEIETVDVITFGSPCQDLSIAGKRKGLSGERSCLFGEAIRIIKEMRCATNGKYPTFIIWENVLGAYSSNGGEDFRVVLEEIAKITETGISVPRSAKWKKSGEILADGWSIAWRTLDAQYWGVPQRRKRIFLVADFRGERAGKILFERDGLQGDIAQGKEAGKGITADVGRGVEAEKLIEMTSTSATLRAQEHGHQPVVCIAGKTEYYPLNLQIVTRHNALGRGTGFGLGDDGEPAYTLQAGHEHGVAICIAGNTIDRQIQNGGNGVGVKEGISYTLDTVDRHAVYCSTVGGFMNTEIEKSNVLMARDYKDPQIISRGDHAVRRLTPLECCRLQGFPDWWCDGVEGSDTAQYKMWGNGIALPCALYVMEGVKVELRRI